MVLKHRVASHFVHQILGNNRRNISQHKVIASHPSNPMNVILTKYLMFVYKCDVECDGITDEIQHTVEWNTYL